MAKKRSIEANHDAWVSLNFSSGRAIVAYPNTIPKDALTELTTIALIICEMIGFKRSKLYNYVQILTSLRCFKVMFNDSFKKE